MRLMRCFLAAVGQLLAVSLSAQNPNCLPPPGGLVGWWPGDGQARDLVGTSHGAIDGAVRFAPGQVGQAFWFDGANSAVVIPRSRLTDLGAGAGLTIAAWLQPAADHLCMWIGWSENEGGYGPYGYLTGWNRNSIYFNLVDTGGNGHVIESPADTVVLGEIQHIAATYDQASGQAVIYRNGVPVASADLGHFRVATDQRIVLGRQPPDWAYEGMLDELLLCDRALAPNEIAAIVTAGQAGLCKPVCTSRPEGPGSWWPGDGHLYDVAGTNHGRAGSAVSFVPGPVGHALSFVNSAESYVEFPNDPLFQPTDHQLTIMAWVKPDFGPAAGVIDTVLMKRDACGSPYSYALCIVKGFPDYPYGVFGLGMPPQLDFMYSTERIPDDGRFHHIAATYNGNRPNGNCVLYLDGRVVGGGDGPGAIPVTGAGPVMGRHAECGYYSTAAMDEVMFLGRELGAAEIQAVVAAGTAGVCKPPVVLEDLQPLSQTRAVGGRARFDLRTAGPVQLQWRRNGLVVATNDTGSLELSNVQITDAGQYDVLARSESSVLLTSRQVSLKVVDRDVRHACLAGWWPGEGDANDALGFLDGSVQGAAGFTNGILGWAFHPNGGSVDLGRGPALDSFTVALWVWVDPLLNVGEQRVISHDNYTLPGARKAFMLKSTSGANVGRDGVPFFEIGGLTGWQGLAARDALSAGWHHLAGVRHLSPNPGRLELYVDGVRVASADLTVTDTIDSDVSTVLSGVSQAQLIEPFHGRLDEVAIFRCALSEVEIAALNALTPAPDLVVEQVSAPSSGLFGEAMEITWTVRNRGVTSVIAPWTDRLWLGTGTSPEQARVLVDVPTTNATPLAAGAAHSRSATVRLPLDHGLAPGPFHLGVTADVHGQVREAREDNNVAASDAIGLERPALPDLAVTQVSGPTTSAASQRIDLVWTVTNRGPAVASGPWVDAIYLARDASGTEAQLLGEVAFAGSLAAGAAATITQQATMPSRVSGDRVLIVKSDARDQVFESDDANNERVSGTITLLPPPRPDLTLVDLRAPGTIHPGEIVTVSWSATNQGDAPASAPWTESIYLAPAGDASAGMAVGNLGVGEALAAGSSVTRTQQVSIPSLPAGAWRWGVFIDSGGQLADEQVKTNNLVFGADSAQLQPALVLSLSPSEIAEDASHPAVQGAVQRNGDLTQELTVALGFSDPFTLAGPTNVVIPAGQATASFAGTVIRNGVVEDGRTAIVQASAPGYVPARATVKVLNTDVHRLVLRLETDTLAEGRPTLASVVRDEASADPLLVRIRASHARQVLVPDTVTIPPGQTSASFSVLAVEDRWIEANESYTVTVTATGLLSGTATVAVVDNDRPALRVDLPFASLGEGDGLRSATVARDAPGPQAVAVAFEASHPDRLWLPERVTIPAGEGSASFPLLAVDNSMVDGSRQVELRAWVLDSVSGEPLPPAVTNAVQVADNEGPSLALTTAQGIVAEGLAVATIGTVTRNTTANEDPLVVALRSSDPTEATVPAEVSIPAGQAFASFDVTTVQDGLADGSQRVIVEASAAGFNGRSTALVVSDRDLPDLVVGGFAAPATGVAGESVTVSMSITNQGLSSVQGPFDQWLFLSADPVRSDDDLFLGSRTLVGTLVVGASAEFTTGFTLPDRPGQYWLIAVADVGQRVEETLEENNTAVSPAPLVVAAAYLVTVQASVETALAGTAVGLQGQATRAGGGPAAFEPVNVHVLTRGTVRLLSATTGADGTFAAVFQPLPGEAAVFQIGAGHPADPTVGVQDEFVLLGMRATPDALSARYEAMSVHTNQFTLANLCDRPLTGLEAAVEGVGTNLQLTLQMPTSLAAQASEVVRYTLRVGDDSVPSSDIRVRLSSLEGATADFAMAVRVRPARVELVSNPGYLRDTMLRGRQRFVRFEVINTGGVASGDLDVLIPDTGWLAAVSSPRLTSLDPGQRAVVELALTPPADLKLGPFTGSLAVSGPNATLSVPFEFTAVSDEFGALLVSVADDFTYTADGAPKVTNAVVVLTDPVTGQILATAGSGPTGEALIPNLPEAHYNLAVRAAGHGEFVSTFLLSPGRTNRLRAFLPRQFVSYSWNVVPIEVEDRYEFEIEAKFETHVPAPVVTVEPASFDLSSVGDDIGQVNVTLANQGLIAARDVRFTVPSDPRWRITPLLETIGDLPALSSVVVPVMLERLPAVGADAVAPPPGDSGGVSIPMGGDCYINISLGWWYPCGPETRSLYVPLIFLNPSPGCNKRTVEWTPPPPPPLPPRLTNQIEIVKRIEIIDEIPWPEDDVDVSFQPPDFGWLRSLVCSPCFHALLKCGIDFGELLSEGAECASDGYACLKGLAGLKWTWSSVGAAAWNCAKAAGKCLERAKKRYKEVDPYFKAIDCLGGLAEGCLGVKLGDDDDPPGLARSPEPISPAEAMLREYYRRTTRVVNQSLAYFGDPAWLQVIDTASLGTWLEAFNGAQESTSDQADWVSEPERAALLALPLPPPLTPAQAAAFLDRWNRTLDYWQRDWFRAADVAPGADTNFLALDVWTNVVGQAAVAFAASAQEGFPLILDGLAYARERYLEEQEQGSAGTCAKVSLKLQQSMAITRTAFEGTLEINNGSGSRLTNILVTLDIRGPAGEVANDRFGIREPRLIGLSAVNGSGALADGQVGQAVWVFLPTRAAAAFEPARYTIGGQVTYVQDGLTVTQPLFPVPIQVLPDPLLAVKYFWPRDVDSDDPFTPEREPAVPFALGLLVANEGQGAARNVRISSGQPEMVDNDKGLLIDFQLVGSQVGTNAVTPSLNVDLGDLAPGGTAVAAWWMTASLRGRFVDYRASFTHVDALGDSNLSLVDRVETHELTRVVRADRPGDDAAPDFLANDGFDLQHLPDTLHLSQGGALEVGLFTNAAADGSPSPADLSIELSATAPAGWGYLRLPDPAAAAYRLVRVLRSDGRVVRLADNVWRTQRVVRQEGEAPVEERWLHLLDFGGTGLYTLTYEAPAAPDLIAPSSAVDPLPANSREVIPVRWSGQDNGGSGLAWFDVFVSVNGGPWLPWLERTPLRGADYEGVLGQRYAFRSLATDLAGNREVRPDTADATTVVSLRNLAPTLNSSPNQDVDEGGSVTWIAVAEDADGPVGRLVYSLDPGAPANATIDPSTGEFAWTPSESDGGSTRVFTVRVQDTGDAAATATQSFGVMVREVNAAPVILELADQNVALGQTLTFGIPATDPDLPANSLSFTLGAGAPATATLNPATGVFSWTPAIAQGVSTNRVIVVVTDNGAPNRSATNSFRLIARQRNTPPALNVPGPQTVDELKPLVLALSAADAESGPGQLSYALQAAPPGASLDESTGLLTWTPTEAQGPGPYVLTVAVTDDGWPPLAHSGTIQVLVREVNRAPHGPDLPDWIIDEGEWVRFAAGASDDDLPANALTYSLGPNAPVGAAIDPLSGEFSWSPREFQGASTNLITLQVTDDGLPSLTATQRVRIVVLDTQADFQLSLGSTSVAAGQTGSVPLGLLSGAALQSLACELELPADLLTQVRLTASAPSVASATLTPVGDHRFAIQWTSPPGQELTTAQPLSHLEFVAPAGQSSVRALMKLVAPSAVGAGGQSFHGRGAEGRVVIVGAEPLLEVVVPAPRQPQLAVYAPLGATVMVERQLGQLQPAAWGPHVQVTVTHLPTLVPLTFDTAEAAFYRAFTVSGR